ncbi:MAG: ABC transporter permease [Conexivisphaerales archaeon]
MQLTFLRAILREKEALAGLLLLSPIILAALFANFIAPYNPLLYSSAAPLQPPSPSHLMGTDQTGGDIFSQVVYGARVALYVATGSVALSVIIAVIAGLSSGYIGGLAGDAIMRIADLILSIPSFVLIILVVVLFGSKLTTILLIIALVSWPTLARIIRAEVLSLKEREFVLAAKATGAGSLNLMFDEILPNIWFKLMPAVTLQAGLAVVVEAGISFLGLGDPNASSWGRTLMFAYQSVYSGAWWGILFPTVSIVMTVIGFNLLGEGISKALSPKIASNE